MSFGIIQIHRRCEVKEEEGEVGCDKIDKRWVSEYKVSSLGNTLLPHWCELYACFISVWFARSIEKTEPYTSIIIKPSHSLPSLVSLAISCYSVIISVHRELVLYTICPSVTFFDVQFSYFCMLGTYTGWRPVKRIRLTNNELADVFVPWCKNNNFILANHGPALPLYLFLVRTIGLSSLKPHQGNVLLD